MKKYNMPLAEMMTLDTLDIMVTSQGSQNPQDINDPYMKSIWDLSDFPS